MAKALQVPPDFRAVAPKHTVVELSSIYDVSYTTIRNWKRKSGVNSKAPINAPHPPPDDLRAVAPERTITELAKLYGVSTHVVRRWLAKADVKQKGWRGAYRVGGRGDTPEQIDACLNCPYPDCRPAYYGCGVAALAENGKAVRNG